MSFIRKIKRKDSTYLVEVESVRVDGKVKQKVIRYLGKEVLGKPEKKVYASNLEVTSVKQFMDYNILHRVSKQLNIPELLGQKLRSILVLVYTQLLTQKPLYKIPEYAEHTAIKEIIGIDKLVDKQLFEALDELDEMNFSRIEDGIYDQFNLLRKEKKVLVLDVTDTYFNGSQADWKARKGKDGKYDKLVQIALAVTKDEGFPIIHKMYEGNIGNTKIFQDMLSDIRLKNFDTIVLDRGMISAESISDLAQINQKVISGLRLHSTIKTQYIDQIDREEIYQPSHRVILKNTEVYAKEFSYNTGKLICIYNPKLEAEKRNHAMDKEDSYKPHEAKYMGYSLIYHSTTLKVEDVVKTYFEKDIVEKAYRELKSSINLHPIRKHRIQHIRAHIKICYLAYAILAYIQYKLKPKGISATLALDQMRAIYQVDIESKKDKISFSKTVTLKKDQKAILKALGM